MIKKYSKKAFGVWKEGGLRLLIRKIQRILRIKIAQKLLEGTDHNIEGANSTLSVRDFLMNSNQPSRGIPFIKIESSEQRLNIVTDSIKKESLFGGVGTSLILAALFANHKNIPLRIISRSNEGRPKDFDDFLSLMKIERPKKVEFFSDFKPAGHPKKINRLEVSNEDIFLATSWWSAKAIQSVNQRSRFFYLLQEVEFFFYPNGDEQWQCYHTLKAENIHYLLNTKILKEYYHKNCFENIVSKSCFFEPAFPEHIYNNSNKKLSENQKRKLFFYSRPNNPRNLFKTGLEILDEALLSGILNSDEWDIYFAGNDLPNITFSNGLKPIILGHMSWPEYVEFIKTVDLGFSLMYTPHPSYPPLDIAASGGVVLTNKYPGKEELPYSKNILCEDLDLDSMLAGFQKAIVLAKDDQKRQQHYMTHQIKRDWKDSLASTLQYMSDHL